jgi:hypothetical protein
MVKQWYLLVIMLGGSLAGLAQITMEETPPFKLLRAFYTEGEAPEVTLVVKQEENSPIAFKKLFFRGRWTAVQQRISPEGQVLEFVYDPPGKKIIMHADSRREVGNQPPKLKTGREKEQVFNTAKDEAVLLYEDKGQPGYYLIRGIRPGAQQE